MSSGNLVARFRGWALGAVAIGGLLYVGGSLWAGLPQMREQLGRFPWLLAVPVLALTLLNYGLRFAKWHYLLGRLGVSMPLREDAWNFTAGLAMVISPGKAGELLKPYVVRARTGVPMATTIPALVTERLTDGIAMLLLASVGITTFAADRLHYVTLPAAATVLGLGVLASERLTGFALALAERVPGVRKVVPKVRLMVDAMRRCTSPVPLLLTVFISLIAWGAECLGYLLVLHGLGVEASLRAATFLYAFATVAGGAMPGGLGVAEGALVAMPMAILPGMEQAQAVTSAMLIRVATLWLGVGLGAIALFRVSSMLGGDLELEAAKGPTDSSA